MGNADTGPPTLGLVGPDGLITVKRTLAWCGKMSHSIVVSPDERKVFCSNCKREFDPIDALMQLAQWPDRWRDWTTHMKGEYDRAKERLADIKRQINNAKATLRRRSP